MAGNYRLIRMLGGGGQGEVWLGQNDTMQREGAIKLITYDQVSEDETQRYLDEVKITANLDHENIVKALDSGPFRAGVVYLVLVYAKDGTLREKHAGQCVPLPKVLSYTKQVAAGLQYAHDRQLNHLDIKPSNLLVGPNDQVWISDFGIARIAQSERSLGRMLRNAEGTIGYMSPEQLDGEPSAASDQYSLAVVVYEWICGHRPFSGGNALQVQGQQRTKILNLKAEVPHLQISTEVEQVVLKALNYEPEKRFFTVRDFAHSLELAINDPEHFVLPASPSFHSVFSQSTVLPPTPPPVPTPSPPIFPPAPSLPPVASWPSAPASIPGAEPQTNPEGKKWWEIPPLPRTPEQSATYPMPPGQVIIDPIGQGHVFVELPVTPPVRPPRPLFVRLQKNDRRFVGIYVIADLICTLPLALWLRNGNVWIAGLTIVVVLRFLCGCATRKWAARLLVLLPILYWPLGMLAFLLLLHSQLYVLVVLLACLSWFLQDYLYIWKKRA